MVGKMLGIKVDEEIELRIHERHYASQVFELVNSSRSYLREWLPWVDATQTVKDTEEFIASTQRQFGSNDGFQVSVWYNGQIAGCAGFHGINWPNRKTSIGYWLGSEFQGRGIISRTCKALIDHAFNEYGLNKIEIACATDNKKSWAVPERLGFKHEGTLRAAEVLYGQVVDHEIYGLLSSEYEKKHQDA